MKKIILLVGVIAFIIGCSKSTEPGVTEKIDLGYGESVANCDQKSADEVCRSLGWEKAVNYYCKTIQVSSPLGFWNQDVMYTVTCWKPA